MSNKANGSAFEFEEFGGDLEVKGFSDEGVVTDFVVGIEGEMSAVDGEVRIESSFKTLII